MQRTHDGVTVMGDGAKALIAAAPAAGERQGCGRTSDGEAGMGLGLDGWSFAKEPVTCNLNGFLGDSVQTCVDCVVPPCTLSRIECILGLALGHGLLGFG